jgi:menaquinol-cytochrome c reductase iron-sulfur subunit
MKRSLREGAASPASAAEDDDSEEMPHDAPPATADQIARRQLLGKMSLAIGLCGGAAISVPGIAFIVAPIFRKSPQEWKPVSKVEADGNATPALATDFVEGMTVNVVFIDASPLPWAGVTSKSSAWLRRVKDEEFIAFSVNCAHLGCPVRWIQDARLFMCPCHGGVYYEDGSVAAGPPPHPLTRYPVRVNAGVVEILSEPIPIG